MLPAGVILACIYLQAGDQIGDADDERLPRPIGKVSGGFAELLGTPLQLKPRQELLALFGQIGRAREQLGIARAKLLGFQHELVMALQALAALARKPARALESRGELARHSRARPAQLFRRALQPLRGHGPRQDFERSRPHRQADSGLRANPWPRL